MTQKTHEILKSLKTEAEKKIREMGAQSDGGHARASFHDDAGFEHEKNSVLASLSRIGDLERVSIIEPRFDTNSVGLGNKIRALFVEEKATEILYLLGEDDVVRRRDLDGTIVSPASPLGKAINGRSQNEVVEVRIGSSNEIHVKILGIEKGDF